MYILFTFPAASPAADITVDIPQFHGDSYLELPLSVNPSKSIAVEIWFLPLKENGKYLCLNHVL